MFSMMVSCVSASRPFAVMPSRSLPSRFFIRSHERRIPTARRSSSASEPEKLATTIAMRNSCSWKSGTPRHIHDKPYASIVLSGGYEEAGDHGRFRVSAGDVIFHERFEAHLDRFSAAGVVVLNLKIPDNRAVLPGL